MVASKTFTIIEYTVIPLDKSESTCKSHPLSYCALRIYNIHVDTQYVKEMLLTHIIGVMKEQSHSEVLETTPTITSLLFPLITFLTAAMMM